MRILFKLNYSTLFSGFLSFSSVISSGSVFAESNSIAFGDVAYRVNMDAEWRNRAVKHDAKFGEVDLVVSLGQITYPALHQFVADYAKQKGLKIIVQPGSCGVSAKKISRKIIDIGAYCCPPGQTDRLPGIEFHTIGISPIALITHPDNQLSGITLKDAQKIFSGDTVKWSEVPLNSSSSVSSKNKIKLLQGNIQPVVRLHCKKRPGHWHSLLESDDMFSRRIREVGVIPDMVKEVAETKSAIGFETEYMLKVYKKQGKVKVLTIDGHSPSDLQTLLSANYPFYRTFSLTTWTGTERSNQLSRELIDSIKKHIEVEESKYDMIPSSKLRLAGWKFKGDELIGEPNGKKVFSEHQR
ncbi:hypothetical protein MNBD_GAMMA05-1088 [hydrothermal vent metagenome]|uniref:Phosphate ABC transporter, periplasmic phosphate-binding protein PstS (TC 3.A.1.7.1) n=1 Tax=hydrothermal vent metagenome TaxID=652676 RepID=A0A3B0WJ12_9ZZZZ